MEPRSIEMFFVSGGLSFMQVLWIVEVSCYRRGFLHAKFPINTGSVVVQSEIIALQCDNYCYWLGADQHPSKCYKGREAWHCITCRDDWSGQSDL